VQLEQVDAVDAEPAKRGVALGEHVESLRAYPSYHDIRKMVVRSAYAQLRFSAWRLAAVVVAMALVFVAPPVLAIAGDGWTRAIALATWALMALLFVPTLRRYRVPAWTSVFLPAIAATYLAFTVESAIQHRLGRGHGAGLHVLHNRPDRRAVAGPLSETVSLQKAPGLLERLKPFAGGKVVFVVQYFALTRRTGSGRHR